VRVAHDAVQPLQLRGRELLAPVDDRRRAGVGGAGLCLLVVGQGQHAQREDLVDLGGVEHRDRALRGHRRVVGQDDRRGEDDVGLLPVGSAGAGENRPAAVLRAPAGRLAGVVRRVDDGDEPCARSRQEQVGADQRGAQGGLLVGGAGAGVPDRHPQPEHRSVRLGGELDHRAQRPPAPDQSPGRHGLDVLAAVDLHHEVHPAGELDGREGPELPVDRDRLVPRRPDRRPGPQLGHGRDAARAVRALGLPPLQLQETEVDGNPWHVAVRPHQAVDREVRLLAEPGRRGTGRAQHPELPAHLVLGGRRPVGVEQVPLVEDGVGGEPGQGERHGRSPAVTSASSAATTSSQLVSPRTCR
jgi:hypothetical protein